MEWRTVEGQVGLGESDGSRRGSLEGRVSMCLVVLMMGEQGRDQDSGGCGASTFAPPAPPSQQGGEKEAAGWNGTIAGRKMSGNSDQIAAATQMPQRKRCRGQQGRVGYSG